MTVLHSLQDTEAEIGQRILSRQTSLLALRDRTIVVEQTWYGHRDATSIKNSLSVDAEQVPAENWNQVVLAARSEAERSGRYGDVRLCDDLLACGPGWTIIDARKLKAEAIQYAVSRAVCIEFASIGVLTCGVVMIARRRSRLNRKVVGAVRCICGYDLSSVPWTLSNAKTCPECGTLQQSRRS